MNRQEQKISVFIDLADFAGVKTITLDADVKVRHKIFTSV